MKTMELTEKKTVTNDNIINVTVKITKRRNPISPFDRQRIYWRSKKMNNVPTPKYGSLKNICNYYRVTEEEVFQIIDEESTREKRCHHYWSRKINERIMTIEMCDKSISPETVGTIKSVAEDGIITVLWDNGIESKIEDGMDIFHRTWL